MAEVLRATAVLLALIWQAAICNCQGLQPSLINIAHGKRIVATATCGEGGGIAQGEVYCRLATVAGGRSSNSSIRGDRGLWCSKCDSRDETFYHPIEYAIDGSEKWWQSPPLSRGRKYQTVDITIDLGQEYQVAYVIVKAGNAPRPGVWALEKSADGGKTFQPWQYFATSASECLSYFGVTPLLRPVQDDTVICSIEYSQVPPFENGEIHISLVNDRPGASNFSHSKELQAWTLATHVRLRLLKVKTLLADLLPLAREDPTVTRRYFYSIKDISIGGICMCNGHADGCIYSEESSQFACQCKHNTCGTKCDKCCPGFVQKKWRPGNGNYECEACNCHGHSTECRYDELVDQQKRSLDQNGNYEGGGVCIDCQHNTAGINCERCKPGYYRPTGVQPTARDACQNCNCDTRFSTGRCSDGDGNCQCLERFSGPRCNKCSEGFYDFPNCKPCECHPLGTAGGVCGPVGGQCPCKPNYTGAKCDRCAPGHHSFPQCRACACHTDGAIGQNCDPDTGKCQCGVRYTGLQCDQCSRGYYNFPTCQVCNCDSEGTAVDICDPNSGRCVCMPNFGGPRCDICNDGFYRFPFCISCNCSGQGSVSPNCSQYGSCSCKKNYEGRKCDFCRLGYYDFPRCIECTCDERGANHKYCDHKGGQCSCKGSYKGLDCNLCQTGYYGFPDCKRCQCNPYGVKPVPGTPLGDCSFSNTGQCDCKDNVEGLQCTECKDGSYNLQANNPLGCEPCNCNRDGVIGGLVICNDRGQCPCKMYVTGRACGTCKAGYFGLRGFNIFGCSGCDCDVGGSYDQNCNDVTGQCRCRPNVRGRTCAKPSEGHFSPFLLHIKAEVEDGSPVSGKSPDEFPVRFGFDESVFPGFSWRGYAVVSDLQRSIRVSLDIPKAGPYFLLVRYVLEQDEPATAEVTLTSRDGMGNKQSSALQFAPTKAPAMLTVGGSAQPVQFMLTPGKWDLQLDMAPAKLLLDFVSAIPGEYAEASVLSKKVTRPCRVNGNGEVCNQFSFPSLSRPDFPVVEVETGYWYSREQGKYVKTQVLDDPAVLRQLDFNALALLNGNQTRVTEYVEFRRTGRYVLVAQYYRPGRRTERMLAYLRHRSGYQRGAFYLNDCPFRFGCRQVAVDETGKVQVFDVESLGRMAITLLYRGGAPAAVDSITAIPLEQWKLDYIVPSILCTTKGNKCIPSSYPTPKEAVKVDVDGDDADTGPLPPNIVDPTVKLKYLQGGATYEIAGSVPKPGRYAIVLHYYQPDHVTFRARASVVSDRALPGEARFMYCPHTSGCRAVLQNNTDDTAGTLFDIGRTSVSVKLTLPANTSAWLDYALFVRKDLFSPWLSEAEPVSFASDFQTQCAQDSFQISSSASSFCKASTFSLTTNFLQTTLPCDCGQLGSLHSTCAAFGGQCPCRDHVIGRKCSRCKSGYYGFPNCRKCRCLFCNEVSGACDCPPKTVGANCELCVLGTYGHDPIIGCRDCACDRSGVVGGDISCDAQTGQCQCRPSHQGRRCDECAPGYHGYPQKCQKCDCDARGITGNVCDSQTGKCFCKAGVTGDRCDKCAPGFFNLDARNPDGCTPCWCSGLSRSCISGDFYRSTEISAIDGWLMENTLAPVTKSGPSTLTVIIAGERIVKNQPVYWVAPAEYLGRKILSYGGNLTYSIRYDQPKGDASALLTRNPDVVIQGSNGVAIQYKEQIEADPGSTFYVRAKFMEDLWETTGGSNVTRAAFMSVLLDVQSLRLRASYSTRVADVSISDVNMDSTVERPRPGAEAVSSIEVCDCPAKATGSSCELCGPGYTRARDNTTCVACECSGHSANCHPEIGGCFNCTDNTAGDRCELCQPGYYDADPSPAASQCNMCACPLAIPSNNFAANCSLGADRIQRCSCKEGYSGSRCGTCADGYYGDPSVPGDYCKRCDCNGNIDPSVAGSCDPATGKCLKCINGATGDKCERCVEGYYGDAVDQKNCTKCRCDACGAATALCNTVTGACACKPNVMGDTCDTCKPNSWGFETCLGCQDCACAEASLGPSCDVTTGQCSCATGVAGRQCDRCRAGFWDYTRKGCTACNCPGGPENLYGFCDVNTGQCCQPGGNCTICPRGYRPTPGGCEFCGDCVDRLLGIATELNENITRVLDPLQSDVSGILVQTGLDEVNKTLQRLIPEIDVYNSTMGNIQEELNTGSGSDSKTPSPLAVYPLNETVRGKDIGPNSFRDANVFDDWGPDRHGQPGAAMELLGDNVEISNEGALDTRRSVSLLMWVNHRGSRGPILHYYSDGRQVLDAFSLWLTSSGSFEFSLAHHDMYMGNPVRLVTPAVAQNVWHHVAAVYDYMSGVASVRVDGNLVVDQNVGQMDLATESKVIYVGFMPGVDYVFEGMLSCVQFYGSALTQPEIVALMDTCPTGSIEIPGAGSSLAERTTRAEAATAKLDGAVTALEDLARNTSAMAAATRNDALALENDVMKAVNVTGDIIKFVQEVADALKEGEANQSALIQKAEEILEMLREVDYSLVNASVSDERDLATLALNNSRSNLDEAQKLWSLVREANRTLRGLESRLGQILKKSTAAWAQAIEAATINSASKGFDSQTPMRIAQELRTALNVSLNHVSEVLQAAGDSLNSSALSFESFSGDFPQLDDLIRQVNERLANLTEACAELEPLVKMADDSASRLRSQADELAKLLTDTEQFAGKAVNASRRYSQITNALNSSWEIAKEAERIASDAQRESLNISSLAELSKNRSNALSADVVTVEGLVEEVGRNFTELKSYVQDIKQQIRQGTTDLASIDLRFSEMETYSDIENRSAALEEAARDSFNTADEAREIAEDIERNLPTLSPVDDARKEYNDTFTDVKSELDEIAMNRTNISRRMEVLRQFHREAEALDTEVKERIEDIQNMMSESYSLLDSLSLVMRFGEESSVIRSPPPTARDKSRLTNLLLYAKPQSDTGLLAYLGGVKKRKYRKRMLKDGPARAGSELRRVRKQTQRRRKRQIACQKDFAALFMNEMKVHFALCMDGVLTEVIGGVALRNGSWNEIQADISTSEARLRVSYTDESKKLVTKMEEKSLSAGNPFLEIGQSGKLVIGGIPADKRLASTLPIGQYHGCIDGLEVNGYGAGPWNAEFQQNVSYCAPRKEFIGAEGTYQLYGVGYLQLDTSSINEEILGWEFTFTTPFSNGLLLIGMDNQVVPVPEKTRFFAVEIISGKLVYSYNVGQGIRKVASEKSYDDLLSYKMEMTSRGLRSKSFTLTIRDMASGKVAETLSGRYERGYALPVADYVFNGGISNRTRLRYVNITSRFFRGCISNIIIKSKPRTPNFYSTGYKKGCAPQVSRTASLPDVDSFLEWSPQLRRSDKPVRLGFAFRTRRATGTLLYEAHTVQKDYLTVGLLDGRVILKANAGKDTLSIVTVGDQYGDDKWHFTTVYIGVNNVIQLSVDRENFTKSFVSDLTKVQTSSSLYIGGVPLEKRKKGEGAEVDQVLAQSMGGSIRDFSIGDRTLNFAKDFKSRKSVDFGDEESRLGANVEDFIVKKTTPAPTGSAPPVTLPVTSPLPKPVTNESFTATITDEHFTTGAVTDEPSTESTTDYLSTAFATDGFSTELATDRPSTEPTTEKPSTEPATDGPSTESATDKPSTESATDEPSTESVTDDLSTESATDDLSTESATDALSTESATDEPSTESATDKPSTESATDEPSTEPATDEPSTEPATDDLSTESATDDLSTESVTDQPSTEPATDGLSTEPATDDLSTESTVEKPSTTIVTPGESSTATVTDAFSPPAPLMTSEPTDRSTAVTTESTAMTSEPTAASHCVEPEVLPQNSSVLSFGVDVYSHLQYTVTASRELGKLIGSKTKIQLEFKTFGTSGILLYVAEPSDKQSDYIACYMEKGKAVCSFSCGGGSVKLESKEKYNDGLWHILRFNRKGRNGTLHVDDVKVDYGQASGTSSNIDRLQTLYIGGVSETANTKRVPKNMRSFPGCVRNFTVNKVSPKEPLVTKKTVGCYSEDLTPGVSFQSGGGYIKLVEKFSVAQDEDITLEIRPTSHTALILSVAKEGGDYLALEMVNGSLIFRLDNGGGAIVVTLSQLELCDGHWHKIRAWKKGHRAWLQVDQGEIGEATGKQSQTFTNVYDPLYVGGLPDGVQHKGVTVREYFMGCMRNLVTDGIARYLSAPVLTTGNVYRGGCVYRGP